MGEGTVEWEQRALSASILSLHECSGPNSAVRRRGDHDLPDRLASIGDLRDS
jgi:hypothetical protein